MLESSFTPSYNPIVELFERLRFRHFEGSPLDEFLEHLTMHDGIINTGDSITAIDMKPYIKKWLMSVVASAYGEVSEMILVMISKEQGTGKTEFFSRLLPDKIKDYFVVDQLDRDKDSDLLMTSKLIILDDEYGGKSKKDAAHIKAKASQKSFSIRKAYGRDSEDYKRLAVLCGATNSMHIINDSSGNRRIIPVHLKERDYQKSDAIDRYDLWADLTQQYFQAKQDSTSDPYKLNSDDYKIIQSISDGNQFTNDCQEYVLRYFAPGVEGDELMSATEILDYIFDMVKNVRLNIVKLGQELNNLGFEAKRTKGKRGYWVKVLDTNEEGPRNYYSGDTSDDHPF